jgi:uncharacterized protein (DUF1778 family)
MSTAAPRTARLETRITPEALAVVRRAAAMQGRSVSDFVVAAVHEAAQRTIADAQIIQLSLHDQERFVAALLDPPPMPDGMAKAAAAHARLVVREP